MNFVTLYTILAGIFGFSQSFELDSLIENLTGDRIIGGQKARLGQFPYQASLRSLRRVNGSLGWFNHLCGASIISSQWILSAAHCAQGYLSNPSRMRVAVGAHHIQNDGEIYPLERIANHPLYNDDMIIRNDISLLRTAKIITFNDVVQSIPLRRQLVGEGAVATLSGWGRFRVAFRRMNTLCGL